MSISTSPQNLDKGRRAYYRIDDTVFLSYRIIPEEELGRFMEKLQEEAENFYFSVKGDMVMAEAIASIRVSQPAIAIYLEALDRKINLLTHLVMNKHAGIEDYPPQQVNLSGGGIAFDVEQEIPIGTNIELKLVLLPRYNGILIRAIVVYCKRQENNNQKSSWRVALNFSHIRDIDRDLIIRHVLRKQAEWIRQHHDTKK